MHSRNELVLLFILSHHSFNFATFDKYQTTCDGYMSIFQIAASSCNRVYEQDPNQHSKSGHFNVNNLKSDNHKITKLAKSNYPLAVVPYNENALLPLHRNVVEHTFVEHKLSIRQNWAAGGVAAVVWDAALTLCEYLESHKSEVESKSVIEIGAGTGLVGMVSALLGADVTVTDRKEALKYLEDSISDNIIDDSDVHINVEELDWTKDYSDKFFTPFDVILGADVIYIEELFPDLLRTISQLSDQKTVIFLSCRIRYDRDLKFLKMMETIYSVDEILYDSTRDIKIFKARKKNID